MIDVDVVVNSLMQFGSVRLSATDPPKLESHATEGRP